MLSSAGSDKQEQFQAPNHPDFGQSLKAFRLLNLHVTLQLQGNCSLPAYKGSMWHGWLGHALRAVSEQAFNTLYQRQAIEQPKPYAIAPGFDQKTEWRAGELIQFSLRLFGAACDLQPIIVKALQQGEQLGIGTARTALRVVAITAKGPAGDLATLSACPLADYLPAPMQPIHSLVLLLTTPLRLKHESKVLRANKFLTAALLASQARRRLAQLSRQWITDDMDMLKAITQQALGAENSKLKASVYFEDWQRFSLKQQEFIPLGGLKGVLEIEQASTELYQWLRIGEQLQLGGKTTFGLGCYSLQFKPDETDK